MARKLRPSKMLIYVFCEGESEQAYAQFLKEIFEDIAVIKYPKGLFEEAQDKFTKDAKYRNATDVIDEIWFFFDVEEKDIYKWDGRFKIIRSLRKLRKKPNIRIRLLMTTGCIEYWFMLHYKYFTPSLSTVPDKENMRRQVENKVLGYEKGDYVTTVQIAQHYKTALINGQKTLEHLLNQGLPTIEDTDERNLWLCRCGLTFTTVQEAISFLENKKII